MFNRRFLRVKILQALYAYAQSNASAMGPSIKELHLSIERTFDLYLYLLNLPIELKFKGEHRLEEGKNKAAATPEDLNPNRKFVDNLMIQKLSDSKTLASFSENRKINWSDQSGLISKFYKMLRSSESYLQYMESGKSDFTEDRDMIVSLFKKVLPEFDEFQQNFNEKSVYWDEEDFHYASFLAVNTMKKLGADKSLDELLKPVYENKEDKNFVEILFKKTLGLDQEIEKMIMEKTKNWDAERIALIDMILMKMALVEIINFNEIPIKVSMNEYIDIAKSFSTPKSGQFINGILDKIVAQLIADKKFKKIGRGLLG